MGEFSEPNSTSTSYPPFVENHIERVLFVRGCTLRKLLNEVVRVQVHPEKSGKLRHDEALGATSYFQQKHQVLIFMCGKENKERNITKLCRGKQWRNF